MERHNHRQNAANYVNMKGINQLFEAMMTALMVRKPDDPIEFLQDCLDRIDERQTQIDWDFFLTKKSSSLNRRRTRSLPPIQRSKPIVFILSCSSISLCSRLLKRYPRIQYLSINNIANIDDDELIDLSQHEDRFDCVKNAIDERMSKYDGFLLAGELNEQDYLEEWQEKLDRIDLVIILNSVQSFDHFNRTFRLLQMNSNRDFEDILTSITFYFDEIFLQHIAIERKFLFCIDHQKNIFLSILCQRLADDLKFKYIQYEMFSNFEQLKNEIFQSINFYSGFIIEQFPRSFKDLQRFQFEIGPYSVLISTADPEYQKAIYVNDRMEIDEIYDDFKQDILKHL